MSSVFKQVETFNRAVVQVPERPIGQISDESEVGFLIGTLHEEIQEFAEAMDQDFIAQIDSLMDLIYFACGGLTRMGIPAELSETIFATIHECNMQKNGGKKESRVVTHDLDAVKPENWVGPEERIARIIEMHKLNQSL